MTATRDRVPTTATVARAGLALMGGLAAGVVIAAIVWGWWRSPVPTFLLFTPLLQGIALGLALMSLFTRLKVRSRIWALLVATVCGATSLAAVALGQYVSDVYDYQRRARVAESMLSADATPPAATAAIDPFAFYDANLLQAAVDRRGFAGYLLLRNRRGVRAFGRTFAGQRLWAIWLGEALLVGGIAYGVAAPRRRRPARRQRPGDGESVTLSP